MWLRGCFARLTQRGRQEAIVDVKCTWLRGSETNAETEKDENVKERPALQRYFGRQCQKLSKFTISIGTAQLHPITCVQIPLPSRLHGSRLSQAAVFEESRPLKGNRSSCGFHLVHPCHCNPRTTVWKAMESMIPFQGFDLVLFFEMQPFHPISK